MTLRRDPTRNPVTRNRESTRRVTRATAAATVFLGFGLGGCAFPGDALEDGEGITGIYSVNGIDPAGIEYSGTVTIVATEDPAIYGIEWLVTGGIHEGTARLRGDTLTAEWSTSASASGLTEGTAVYTIDDDGVLTGERTTDGVDGIGTEEIFPEP